MPEIIIFNCIAVNSIKTGAGVFVGDTAASSWDSNHKVTSAISTVTGAANVISANLTLITDNDIVDTPIMDNDVTGPTAQA